MILDDNYNKYNVDKGFWMQWTLEMQRETVLQFLKGQPRHLTKLISATDSSITVSLRLLNAARKPGYNKTKSKPNTVIAKRIWQCNKSSFRKSALLLSELT